MNPILQLNAEVMEQTEVAEESFILSLKAPSIARLIEPGQFIQIGCLPANSREKVSYDPLLPRPFSIYRVRNKQILDILYEVVGRGTDLLAKVKKGEHLIIFGPLGNTFSYPKKRVVSFLVGGGVGLAPFYDLAEALIDPKRGGQRREDIFVLFGAKHRKKVFCEGAFKKLGVRFEVATDDGSYGFKGFVTQLLEKHLRTTNGDRRTTYLYACGPKEMLKVVTQIAERFKLPCELSIDAHMPCGYGICFGCAVKTRESYKLACTDGPVFRAEELVWD